ncbi:MAG: hypothetical protein L3J71_12945 [Victivallaceae bacterium]|nr:hypothetical protein [Victivallaceae bacterium]
MKMLHYFFTLLLLVTGFVVDAKKMIYRAPEVNHKIENLLLTGTINDRTARFSVKFEVETESAVDVPLLAGAVTADFNGKVLIDKQGWFVFSDDSKVILKNGAYYLQCAAAGKYRVAMEFYAKVASKGTARSCSFALLPAVTRQYKIALAKGNADYEVTGGLESSGAGNAVPDKVRLNYSGVMLPAGIVAMSWRKTLQPGKAPLSLGAFSGTVCSVQAGTIKMNNEYRFDIFQGKLSQLKFSVPAGTNIIGVKGDAIRNWGYSEQHKELTVSLSQEQLSSYRLNIIAEKFLPEIPCPFAIEPIVPLGVMRYGGLLKVGSGRGIKLLLKKTKGLVQIDSSSVAGRKLQQALLELNNSRLFSFSGGNYAFNCEAEAVQPAYTAEMNLQLTYRDKTLRLRLDCAIDVKDAPLQEITLSYDNKLDFSRVSGAALRTEDYDLQSLAGKKSLKLPFSRPLLGKTSFSIYFEREMKDVNDFELPQFKLNGVKSVRGYLMLAAEKGIKLIPQKISNLTPVHTGSVPVRVAGIQQAYLFRSADWQGNIKIEHEKSAIFNEVFHFASAAEGTVYCSSIFLFKISGAPIQSLRFKVAAGYNNLEFKGSNIISRRKVSGDATYSVWEVKLREKVIGATMMMVAYEIPLADGQQTVLGDTNCIDADSSSGFIALTGRKSLKVTVADKNENVKIIDATELPAEYAAIVTTPLLKVFRCSGLKTAQPVVISRYLNSSLPETVIDRTVVAVNLDDNGNAVTTVEYRVKNSIGQFLVLKLPAQSDLWSVEVDGRRKRLSSADGKLLIPLPRYQNINRPIKVVVSYAKNFGKIEMRKTIVVAAPQSSIKQLLTKWSVKVPEKFSIAASEPRPDGHFEAYGAGLTGLVGRLYKYFMRGLRNGMVMAWIIVTVLVGVIILCARKKWKAFTVIFSILLIMFLMVLGGFMLRQNFDVTSQVNVIMNQVDFSSATNLAGSMPQVKLEVINTEAGLPQNWLFSLGGIIAAAVAIVGVVRLKWRLVKIILTGLALTLITLAAVQWFKLSLYTGFGLISLLPLAFSVGLWRVIWCRTGKVVTMALGVMMLIVVDAGAAMPTVNSFKCAGVVREKVVTFKANVNIHAEEPGEIRLVWSPARLTGTRLPDNCTVSFRNQAFYLKVAKAGDFELSFDFIIPLNNQQDSMTFKLPIPFAVTNQITVTADKTMVIKADNAVRTDQTANVNSFSGCFVPGTDAQFSLRQRGKVGTETQSEFFASINGYVKISRGSIEVRDNVTLTVPRGEIQSVELKVSPAMRITSVTGKLVEGWRFERKKSLLKVFFMRPCTGSCTIAVDYQMADPKLPGEITLRPAEIGGAVRQYGTYAVFVENGMSAIETQRKLFSSLDTLLFRQLKFDDFVQKKSYRYAGLNALLAFKVNEVKPEIRVESSYELNYEDEQTLMNAAIDLKVVKGGIFSFSMELPHGFEINRLSGADVQYWNEFKRDKTRHVVVNFKQRISKRTKLVIELASMAGLKPGTREIPALRMSDAGKETGTLKIYAEKGVTVSVASRSGVSRSSNAFKRFDKNVSHFKLLRSGWQLKLKFDVTPPWIQLKTLQQVTVRENEIETRAFLRFNIENSGIKRFRIKLPSGSYGPSFSGRYIAAAGENDNGVWEVNLNRKVEHSYRLEISYRTKMGDAKLLEISPIKVLDVGVQTGYVAVLAEDSLQLELKSGQGDYASYNSRNIPTAFGADDLAAAILCYRSVGTKWQLKIKTILHQSVATLKATIESVKINTLVNKAGTLLSEVNVDLKNGSEKFLKVKLPAQGELWSAFVDEKPVQAVSSDNLLMIPLNPASGRNTRQQIRFIYSNSATKASWAQLRPEFNGPEFTLPLRNVRWDIYLPDNCKYSDFSGTMNFKDEFLASLMVASLREYDRAADELMVAVKGKAKKFRTLGNKLYLKGNRRDANAAFQNAIDISGDNTLRSDIQGEMLQSSRMFNIQNIVNRQQKVSGQRFTQQRSNIAQYRNLQELKGQVGSDKFELSQLISDRFVTQQQAIAARPRQLTVAIPWQGTKITFERGLAIEKNSPLKVTFIATKTSSMTGVISKTVAFSAVFLMMLIIGSLFFVKCRS